MWLVIVFLLIAGACPVLCSLYGDINTPSRSCLAQDICIVTCDNHFCTNCIIAWISILYSSLVRQAIWSGCLIQGYCFLLECLNTYYSVTYLLKLLQQCSILCLSKFMTGYIFDLQFCQHSCINRKHKNLTGLCHMFYNK